jgi:hypothetical protein
VLSAMTWLWPAVPANVNPDRLVAWVRDISHLKQIFW